MIHPDEVDVNVFIPRIEDTISQAAKSRPQFQGKA